MSIAYIGPKSRTEKPRKTKIGTEVAHVTHDLDTTFKVKRSKVNLQGAGHIVAASPTACKYTELAYLYLFIYGMTYRTNRYDRSWKNGYRTFFRYLVTPSDHTTSICVDHSSTVITATSVSYGKMKNLTPCKIETRELIDIQLVRIDYVHERNFSSKFG